MYITLYKNCKLNNTYKNVFSLGKKNGASLIDIYLASLEYVRIEIDNVYSVPNGKFVFPYLNGDIYDYNYMKIENEENNLKRYCFIMDISYVNDLVNLYYEEDIWHSYGNSMKITKSFQSRSKLASSNYLDFGCNIYNPPLNYDGNKAVSISRLSTHDKFKIIVVLQHYQLVPAGETTRRNVVIGLLYNSTIPQGFDFTYNDALIAIGNISSNSQEKYSIHYKININDERKASYDIMSYYILPSSANLSTYFTDNIQVATPYSEHDIRFGVTINPDTPTESFTALYKLYLPKSSSLIELKKIWSYVGLQNDFKRIGIGTMSSMIPCINNGTLQNFEFNMSIDAFGVRFYINYANQLIDVTNDFEFELPISYASSSEVQQQKMAKAIKTWQFILNIAGNSKPLNYSTIEEQNLGTTIRRNSSTTPTMTRLNRQRKTGAVSSISKSGGSTSSMTNISRNVAYIDKMNTDTSGLSSIANSVPELYGLIAPVYSNSAGMNVMPDAFINAYFFIVTQSINSDNDNYVSESIDNEGYEIYEYVTNLNKTGIFGNSDSSKEITTALENMNYNAIKFDFINIYGNFPRSIAYVLEQILLNGTKVWFVSNVQ